MSISEIFKSFSSKNGRNNICENIVRNENIFLSSFGFVFEPVEMRLKFERNESLTSPHWVKKELKNSKNYEVEANIAVKIFITISGQNIVFQAMSECSWNLLMQKWGNRDDPFYFVEEQTWAFELQTLYTNIKLLPTHVVLKIKGYESGSVSLCRVWIDVGKNLQE